MQAAPCPRSAARRRLLLVDLQEEQRQDPRYRGRGLRRRSSPMCARLLDGGAQRGHAASSMPPISATSRACRRGRSSRSTPDGSPAFSDNDDPLTAICAEVGAARRRAGASTRTTPAPSARATLAPLLRGARHRMADRRRRVDRGLRRRHRARRDRARLPRPAGQGRLRQRHRGHAPDGDPQPRQPALWRRGGRHGTACRLIAGRGGRGLGGGTAGADPVRLCRRRASCTRPCDAAARRRRAYDAGGAPLASREDYASAAR